MILSFRACRASKVHSRTFESIALLAEMLEMFEMTKDGHFISRSTNISLKVFDRPALPHLSQHQFLICHARITRS
jgi:hypothetical protein